MAQEKMSATIRDVARLAGTSTATVSKVMNGSYSISKETADRVRKAMDELDYHPNRAAQDLRRRKSRQITVVAESYDYLHIEKLAAIKEYAANCGPKATNPTACQWAALCP